MKSMTSSALAGLALVVCATNISLAAVELVKWDIYSSDEYIALDNPTHSRDGSYATVTPRPPAANVTASAISRGRGWAPDLKDPSWENRGAGLFVSHTGWTAKSLSAAITGEQYFEMTIAAADGFALSLSSIGLSLYQQNPNDSATVVVTYSTDNFATSASLPSINKIPVPWWTGVIADFSLTSQPALQNLTGPVTFRVYGYNFSGADAGLGRGGGANTDARIVGDIVAIPEVASLGLLAAGIASLARSRRSARAWS